MNKIRIPGSVVFGIVLIAVGVISLLSGLNYIESWDVYSTFWPMILILFGVKHLLDYESSNFFGLVLILVGTIFQLDRLNIVYFEELNMNEVIIPLIIILIGLSMIWPKRRYEKDTRAEGIDDDEKVSKEKDTYSTEASTNRSTSQVNESITSEEVSKEDITIE